MSGLVRQRPRLAIATLGVAVFLATAGGGAASAQAAQTCTWAGTATDPTGTFSITPGLTNIPSAGPLKFKATGLLAGGGRCTGRMTWIGQIDAGSSCAAASFEGVIHGLAGVARFWGKGNLVVPQYLYDGSGNLVGIENAQIATQANLPRFGDCATPRGFTGGWPAMFSSVVELFDSQ
jgi:hypothetical protein